MDTPPRVDRQKVTAWIRANAASDKQAAAHFGISIETIRSWWKRHGSPRTKPAEPAQPTGAAVLASAATLPPDDRAELLAHVRSLRRRLVMLDERTQLELGAERPDVKLIDGFTRAASATASEMAKVLEAHPGLMAIVDEAKPVDDAKDAERLAGLYGGGGGLG